MKLILFDVDGTLVDTTRIDGLCFVRAVREVLGISRVDTDWSVYPDTTDATILGHLVEQADGKPPTNEQVGAVKSRFIELVQRSVREDPSTCRPILGGPEFMRHLVSSEDYAVAIATGGWEETARFKLETAGYDIADVPLASSDDARLRTEIMALAVERALTRARTRSFDSITYVGDADWDARAAATSGYRFVRRADPAIALPSEADRVIRDFLEPRALLTDP